MTDAVPGEKRDALPAESPDDKRARWLPERGGDGLLFAIGQLRHVVEAAAADDADLNGHGSSLTRHLPFSSWKYPAAISGSCSKKMSICLSIASGTNCFFAAIVSSG